MIRAYMVTFGFVTDRLLDYWLLTAQLQPDNDRTISPRRQGINQPKAWRRSLPASDSSSPSQPL
jgi:hypothetical protein